ncbi:MAG: response regulator [Gemmatimonadales bacterium]|nr:response regulator [Gemmatimonadales bacterium]
MPPAPRLLVIDDEPLLLRSVQRLLDRAGFAVTTTADGADALRHLEAGAWDLIVCDVNMPPLPPGHLLAHIERQLPHLLPRLVVTSGDLEGAVVRACLERTGCRALPKPYQWGELVTLLGTMLPTARPAQPA